MSLIDLARGWNTYILRRSPSERPMPCPAMTASYPNGRRSSTYLAGHAGHSFPSVPAVSNSTRLHGSTLTLLHPSLFSNTVTSCPTRVRAIPAANPASPAPQIWVSLGIVEDNLKHAPTPSDNHKAYPQVCFLGHGRQLERTNLNGQSQTFGDCNKLTSTCPAGIVAWQCSLLRGVTVPDKTIQSTDEVKQQTGGVEGESLRSSRSSIAIVAHAACIVVKSSEITGRSY